MIFSKTRLLFLSGLALFPLALTSCVDPNAPVDYNSSPSATTSPAAVSASPEVMSPININSASQEDLKKLADKLGIADLPSKIEEKRPYQDINELVSKQVISPQQLDYILNDISVKDVSETTDENATDE